MARAVLSRAAVTRLHEDGDRLRARSFAQRLHGHEPVRKVDRELAGLRTHLAIGGEGATTLLRFPELGAASDRFLPVLVALSSALRGIARIVTVDPPGYGRSVLSRGASMPAFADLSAWLDELLASIAGPVVVLGHSSGAVFAALAASKLGARARGMIFVSWADFAIAEPPSMNVVCPSEREGLLELLRRSWHTPRELSADVERVLLRRFAAPGLLDHARSLVTAGFSGLVGACSAPRAFVGGLSDRLVPPDAIRTSALHHRGSMRWIECAGHQPHQEQPERMAQILEELVCLSLRQQAA